MSKAPFENDDWCVFKTGMRHRKEGYWIDAGRLDERHDDGLWGWPVHLVGKVWFDPTTFAEAFMAALDLHGIKPDAALMMSFAKVGSRLVSRRVHTQAAKDLGLCEPGKPYSIADSITVTQESQRRMGAPN